MPLFLPKWLKCLFCIFVLKEKIPRGTPEFAHRILIQHSTAREEIPSQASTPGFHRLWSHYLSNRIPQERTWPGLVPRRIFLPLRSSWGGSHCMSQAHSWHSWVSSELSWMMQWCSHDNSITSMASDFFLGCTLISGETSIYKKKLEFS